MGKSPGVDEMSGPAAGYYSSPTYTHLKHEWRLSLRWMRLACQTMSSFTH